MFKSKLYFFYIFLNDWKTTLRKKIYKLKKEKIFGIQNATCHEYHV